MRKALRRTGEFCLQVAMVFVIALSVIALIPVSIAELGPFAAILNALGTITAVFTGAMLALGLMLSFLVERLPADPS